MISFVAIGPRQIAGESLCNIDPTETNFTPKLLCGTKKPLEFISILLLHPSINATDGPYMSASSMPTLYFCDSKTARLVVTDKAIDIMSKNSSIEIKMRVQYGIGYVQSSKSSSSRYDLDGIIPVDAIYNPVKKVNFFVEQSKDVVGCERLIMHVETDGSISPLFCLRSN